MSTTYTCSFERIGRNRSVPDHTFTAPNGDAACGEVYSYARRFLGSRDFTVSMFEDGGGSIAGGRFGTFTFTREAS